MAETFQWDQSRFDSTLKEYLLQHESSVWPKLINKKGFFVASGAIPETPRVDKARIDSDLAKLVYTRQGQGSGPPVQVELGYALGAKRAALTWGGSKRFQRAVRSQAFGRGTAGTEAAAWQAEIKAQRGRITGARKSAAGFIRLGWVYVMKGLGPATGLTYYPGMGEAARARGPTAKGSVQIAREGNLNVTITNTAHALKEHRGGFERIGYPALQRSMEKENASMKEHMEKEMEPGVHKFNAQQH